MKITFQQRPVNLWLTTKQVFFGKGHKTWSVPCIGNLFSCFIVGCVTYLLLLLQIAFFSKQKFASWKRTGVMWHPHLPIMAKSLKQPFSLSPRWPLQRSFTVLSSLLTALLVISHQVWPPNYSPNSQFPVLYQELSLQWPWSSWMSAGQTVSWYNAVQQQGYTLLREGRCVSVPVRPGDKASEETYTHTKRKLCELHAIH